MSDYFDNLVVRSFRPLLPVHSLDAPLLAPTRDVPRSVAPATPEQFEDPFAQAAAADDEHADDPDLSPASGENSRKKNTKPRQPITMSRAPSEAEFLENDRNPEGSARSVESSPALNPAAPRDLRIPNPWDEGTSRPETIAASNAGPPVGKPLQPSVANSLEPSKPPSSVPAKDASRSKFRPAPAKKSAEVNSALRPGSSSEQAVALPSQTLSAAEENSPHTFQGVLLAEPGWRAPSSAIVVHRISETIEGDQPTPAPLTTLIPRPGAELLLPPIHKARSNRLPQSEPKATDAEVPPSETVINVSIGRIEVRATPPKARPEMQRNAPHVMNLDDYLRQRSGGSR